MESLFVKPVVYPVASTVHYEQIKASLFTTLINNTIIEYPRRQIKNRQNGIKLRSSIIPRLIYEQLYRNYKQAIKAMRRFRKLW